MDGLQIKKQIVADLDQETSNSQLQLIRLWKWNIIIWNKKLVAKVIFKKDSR